MTVVKPNQSRDIGQLRHMQATQYTDKNSKQKTRDRPKARKLNACDQIILGIGTLGLAGLVTTGF